MELAAIFTATPAEIDTEIARIERDIEWIDWRREQTVKTFLSQLSTIEEAAEAARLNGELGGKANVLYVLRNALQGEYTRRGGWERVYAVNNSNGHFHRTQACSTTYATTPWVWMPELSGLTNAEVVARTGKMSCLVCFGSEREEIEKGREATVFTPAQRKSREERDEFARTSAKLAAEKAAKAITSPDGTPLRTESYGVIKTARTAWIEAVGELEWAEISEHYIATAKEEDLGDKFASYVASNLRLVREHYETTFRIAQAIAHKEDRDLALVMNEIVAKADKKIKKNRKDRAAQV
jgi:hypothetical protein